MKRHIIAALLLIAAAAAATAQPKEVNAAQKAVFTLTTYKADGTLLATAQGFFLTKDGEAVSVWTPFVGAHSAEIIDTEGKKHPVVAVIGANDLYDVCRFRTAGPATPLATAATAAAAGEAVWVATYAPKTAKGQKPTAATINGQEPFSTKEGGNTYAYYILDGPISLPDAAEGCPVVSTTGQALGILQQPRNAYGTHATDPRLTDAFRTTGLTLADATLRKTALPIDLPQDTEQARLFLMMAATAADSTHYEHYIDVFREKFPNLLDAYSARAGRQLQRCDFQAVDQTMAQALNAVDAKADAHAEYAKLILAKEIYQSDTAYAPWSKQKALDEIDAACKLSSLPAYRHQRAQTIYAMGDYQQALDLFTQLTATDLRGGELYYECAQCKAQLKAPTPEITALLDSAVAVCGTPLQSNAAPYVLARARHFESIGEHRKAILDYIAYDTLAVRPTDPAFYYERFQCAKNAHLYQQALTDIARAIILSPATPLYLAEMASLQIKVGHYEQALATARRCVQVAPEYATAHTLLGLALLRTDKKAEGLQALQKAVELGDEQAGQLLEKYKE